MSIEFPSRTPSSGKARGRRTASVVLGIVLGACEATTPTQQQPNPEPTTGALTVEVVTTGEDLGEGYILALNSQEQLVVSNESVSFSDLAPGSYTLELDGADYNCRHIGQPWRTVLVRAGETADVRFAVECAPKLVAYASWREGDYGVYVGSVRGDALGSIAHLPHSADFEPAWSPDGTRLALATDLVGDFANFEIAVATLTGDVQRLTFDVDAIDGMPTWSPFSTHIAYRSTREGNEDIWMMDADGSDQLPLIATPARERLPQWSPDGGSIAYVSDEDGSDDIWVLNLSTTVSTRLTNDDAKDHWPSWAPGGQHIAFASERDGNSELYVMRADGSDVLNVSQAPGSNEWSPAWSPDGRYISFTTDRNGNHDIYWMKSDGTEVKQMTSSPDNDFAATWHPSPWSTMN